MLMVPWSLESSQAVDYRVLSALLPYYSRDTGLRGNIFFSLSVMVENTADESGVCGLGCQNSELAVFRSFSSGPLLLH